MAKTKRRKAIQAEDLYRFELPRRPRISPDGKHVVFHVMRAVKEGEKKFSNLWITSTETGSATQFTYGDQLDSGAEWSPDGARIAFLSNRGKHKERSQIHILPFGGGEARPLTEIKGDIHWLKWSPDGEKLLAAVTLADPEELAREGDEKKRELGVVYRRYERVFYKVDGEGFRPKERTHLWVIDAQTGKAKQITDHDVFDESDAAWSPDGKTVAFISNRSKDPDLASNEDALYSVPVKGGKIKKIDGSIGPKSSPSYSPDGKWIAYYGYQGRSDWWKNTGIWTVPSNGEDLPNNLLEGKDFTASAESANDTGGQETTPPVWSPDGKRIFFAADHHGRSTLKSIDLTGSDLQTHVEGDGVLGSVSLDREGLKAAYFWATMTDPGQICAVDLEANNSRKLTHFNRWLEKRELGTCEEIWFKGRDGNDLQGWILTPPDFDPAKKYPSIMEIHGGPLAQYAHFFMHEFYFLAAEGYVVHFCNPRGGSGYGETHAKAIWGAWGTVDFEDLMAWADLVATKPYIDTDRMGVTGGSYGGYMTLWIIGNTHRFKAAVAQRVLSNFISMWGTSDFNWIFQQVINDVPPFKDLANAWDRSPLKYIHNAKTPTMIIHSENDHRTPIEQGEQAFVALKTLGVDTEFIRFPGEPHGLSRTGRTDRRIARLKHIARWFEKHM